VRVAGPQLALPEVLRLALEAEQRVIRRAPPLDRVVADPGLLLLAVEDQHGGVDVEDQPERRPRLDGHAVQQAVVQGAQLWERRRRRSQEEPPQGRRIGIAPQAGEVLEDPILAKQLRCLEAFQPKEHRVEKRQQHLADAVAPIPLKHCPVAGNGILESDPRQEAVQEVDAPVVGQRLRLKRNGESSRSSAASTLTMAGVPQRTAMAMLGHRDPRMTMRYQHVSPEHLREALRAGSSGTISAPAGGA
jgi:hypothetical protein